MLWQFLHSAAWTPTPPPTALQLPAAAPGAPGGTGRDCAPAPAPARLVQGLVHLRASHHHHHLARAPAPYPAHVLPGDPCPHNAPGPSRPHGCGGQGGRSRHRQGGTQALGHGPRGRPPPPRGLLGPCRALLWGPMTRASRSIVLLRRCGGGRQVGGWRGRGRDAGRGGLRQRSSTALGGPEAAPDAPPGAVRLPYVRRSYYY